MGWHGQCFGGRMNQSQENVTTMFETTAGVLEQNKSVWAKMAAFADAVDRANTGINAIRQKGSDQRPTGDTDAKQAARDAVEAETLVIGSQLSALAAKNNDAMLAAKVNYDRSALDKASVSDLLTAAKFVQGAAAANAETLASSYAISADDLKVFDVAITTLDGMKDAPRKAVVNRMAATLSLPETITSVRGIFRNEIDKMMEKFRRTSPDFYKAYFAARVIIDRTGSHASKKSSSPAAPATVSA